MSFYEIDGCFLKILQQSILYIINLLFRRCYHARCIVLCVSVCFFWHLVQYTAFVTYCNCHLEDICYMIKSLFSHVVICFLYIW